MPVVNLQDRLGKQFRISHDPACDAEHKRPEPEQLVIRCKTGAEIYPFGDETLAVDLEGHRTIRKRLDQLECCQPYQRGDDFASFLFDVADFRAVARIVKPYRRRQLSESERARLIAQLPTKVRQIDPRTHDRLPASVFGGREQSGAANV
jgi:hypothetical protein